MDGSASGELLATREFDRWLASLRDDRARGLVARRLAWARSNDYGDCRQVGEGVIEMRIHFGPGYRVSLIRRDRAASILLVGGTKATQRRDIARAVRLAGELEGDDR